MIQHFLIVEDEYKINSLLAEGWKILSVTAQHVAVSGGGNPHWARGTFAVVLEKEKDNE
jgi:hypothetical protein